MWRGDVPGGLTTSTRYDAKAITAAARLAFLGRFSTEVDPQASLALEERTRRALAARRQTMLKLSRLSRRLRGPREVAASGDVSPSGATVTGDINRGRIRSAALLSAGQPSCQRCWLKHRLVIDHGGQLRCPLCVIELAS